MIEPVYLNTSGARITLMPQAFDTILLFKAPDSSITVMAYLSDADLRLFHVGIGAVLEARAADAEQAAA